jgi:hypothetical protein
MLDRRLRRALAIPLLAAACSLLTAAGVHAAPRRGDDPGWRSGAVRYVLHSQVSIWSWLTKVWEETGMRIDDNG